MENAFHGAKAAVFIGQRVLLYRRDSDVAWGDMWDMPGGGREGDETPRACLGREVYEEFGLETRNARELWAATFSAMGVLGADAWFFVLQFPASTEAQIRFGDEGQYWRLFTTEDVLALPDLIEPLRDRFKVWMAQAGFTPGEFD